LRKISIENREIEKANESSLIKINKKRFFFFKYVELFFSIYTIYNNHEKITLIKLYKKSGWQIGDIILIYKYTEISHGRNLGHQQCYPEN